MTYDDFNKATGFEAKAGFQLSELQKQDAVQFLEWGRSLNLYEVGGGKTVVSTVVSLMSDVEHTVVIVPPILLLPWERWLNKVSERVLRYEGTPKQRKLMVLPDWRWVLMSHSIFRGDFERVLMDFSGRKANLIVDEAQCLKNPSSKIFKCTFGFIGKTRDLQMLTGTPTSTPLDAYSYIKLKSPEIYRSYTNFENCHVAARDFFGAVTEYAALDVLADRFAVKTIKRTKQELHGYVNTPLYPDTHYELSAEHMALYQRLVEEQLLLLDDGSKIDGTTATRLYHLLQQIVVNFDHFSGDPKKRSTSYDLLDMVIEETDCLNPKRSKLIVWTYYKLTSRNVLRYLRSLGYDAVGAYSEVDSAKSFDRFMYDPACRIGVFQPQSAGAGLNPQAVCSESLHLELSTTPMLTRQSCGRLDRVGQKNVPVMRFGVAVGTIQEQLLRQLLEKDDLVAKVERTKVSLRQVLLGA